MFLIGARFRKMPINVTFEFRTVYSIYSWSQIKVPFVLGPIHLSAVVSVECSVYTQEIN